MAETNGMAKITVEGVEYPLLFARAAVQEMTKRSLGNPSANEVKLLTDLVFSGMLNFAIFSDGIYPVYTEVYKLVEKFADEETASTQEELLWVTFESSRWGAEWRERLEEAKKKLDLMTEQIKANPLTG